MKKKYKYYIEMEIKSVSEAEEITDLLLKQENQT